jgi:phage I-like protein
VIAPLQGGTFDEDAPNNTLPVSRSPSDTPIPLTGPQRLHFEVVLASLETVLVEVETSIAGAKPSGSLTRIEHDLPERFLRQAGPLIEALRAQIDALSAALGLAGSRRSATRVVGATLTSQLVHLDDCYADRLRGYGAVDPGVAPRLDPAIDGLRDSVARLLDLL